MRQLFLQQSAVFLQQSDCAIECQALLTVGVITVVRPMHEKVIVLSKKQSKDSDLLIKGINEQGSKLLLYARSALKSKKRFGGGILDPFNYLEVSYEDSHRKKGQVSDLHFLTEAKLIYDFPHLRKDWTRLNLGFYFLQTIEKVSHHELPDSTELFNLLGNSLKTLETSEHLETLQLHFNLKVLHLNGLMPQIENSSEFLALPIQKHSLVPLSQDQQTQLKMKIREPLHDLLA